VPSTLPADAFAMSDKKQAQENNDEKLETQPQEAAVPELEDPTAPQPQDEELAEGDHRLQTPWTFYYDKRQNKPTKYEDYTNNLQKLGRFNTVEGFWRHYSYLKKPEDIPKGHNLFMFRHNYTPAWETFPKGGTWIIKVRKKNGVISRLWEETLFACIGELFEEPDLVGIMISFRAREDLISVWNKDNSNPDVRFNIGEKLRSILNLDESTQVEYKYFRTAIVDGSSFRHAQAYVFAAQPPYSAGVAAGAGQDATSTDASQK
jgi:translation initiation factor 4E